MNGINVLIVYTTISRMQAIKLQKCFEMIHVKVLFRIDKHDCVLLLYGPTPAS